MNRHRPGDHYVICDRTGFRTPARKARKEWNGAVVRDRNLMVATRFSS
jgi:hypothetical protein